VHLVPSRTCGRQMGAARQIPRPAGESAGLRDDAYLEVSISYANHEVTRRKRLLFFVYLRVLGGSSFYVGFQGTI
jgi:hypothetical protein